LQRPPIGWLHIEVTGVRRRTATLFITEAQVRLHPTTTEERSLNPGGGKEGPQYELGEVAHIAGYAWPVRSVSGCLSEGVASGVAGLATRTHTPMEAQMMLIGTTTPFGRYHVRPASENHKMGMMAVRSTADHMGITRMRIETIP